MRHASFNVWLCVPLAAAVLISAVWVIRAKHQSRQLFVELEALGREHDRLQVEWGRLQLEESTLGAHSRVEAIARERLGLEPARPEQIVVVAEPKP